MTARPPRWLQGWLLLAGVLLAALVPPPVAHAHEIRPAYLQVDQISPSRYEVLWRTPVLSGMRLPVVLKFPDSARAISGPAEQELSDSLVERTVIDAGLPGLAGKRIEFVGLQATVTDVLVRVQTLNGTHSTTLVHPSQPWVDIALEQGPLAVVGAFIAQGIEHILLGFDHLLFVLALILIVRRTKTLLWTVTAFTVAHSITLSLATLGLVDVPRPPVEALIALSILLLASENVRMQKGRSSITATLPWVVAFSFGLLHGLGFASALVDIGLPQTDIPLALFAFNVGVELGQLAFIAVVLGAMQLARRLRVSPAAALQMRTVTTYLIGILAAFWFIERLTGFWA